VGDTTEKVADDKKALYIILSEDITPHYNEQLNVIAWNDFDF
jgi:hypothetical protein